MTLFDRIVQVLEKNTIDFSVIEHEPVYTSQEAADVRGFDIKQGAKAMLCFADETPTLIVLSGACRIDTKQFKKSFGIRDLRFATSEEVLQISSVEVGAVPPFGSCMNIQTYCDTSLSRNDEIAFNPGIHTKSIKMRYSDFIQVENPILGDFSNC